MEVLNIMVQYRRPALQVIEGKDKGFADEMED